MRIGGAVRAEPGRTPCAAHAPSVVIQRDPGTLAKARGGPDVSRFEAAADGGLTPYLHVRADLWAKVTRALYYDLVDIGEERMVDGREMFGVASSGAFFAMADAEQVRG